MGVEKHEYAAVAWSFAFFFCVLSSYYILRPIRESMAVGSGPDTIPYLFIGTFTVMMMATPVFGWIASRFPRRAFLPWVYIFFVGNILIFWALFTTLGDENVWLGRAFFVWISVFNLYVVSVFWSFMADIYSREQGRRLFGLISAGGSIGSLIGGTATSLIVTDIGNAGLFPIAAVTLSFATLSITQLRKWVVHEHEHDAEVVETVETEKPLGGSALSGITHVFSSKYFSAIAAVSLIASLLGTALYMYAAVLVEGAIDDPAERTQFFSNMNVLQNAIAMVSQMFLVRHVVARWGLSRSLALMPFLSIIGFAWVALDPTLVVVAIVTAVRRGVGFGFMKPSTDMLYSVVSPEDKYKAKNFIDTAIYRGSDLFGTWTIKLLMAPIIGLTWVAVSVVMIPFAAIWTGIAVWLGREYRRRAAKLKESGIE